MSKILDQAVTQADDGTWDFQCPGVQGSLCGDPTATWTIGGRERGATFSSTGWPTKKVATARGLQHFEDHKGTPMPELDEFRAKHGLVVNDDGTVSLEDI